MSHAEVCPVCCGKGLVSRMNPLETGATQTCHGCGGTGWVTVQDPTPFIPTVTHIDNVKVRFVDEAP